MSVSKIGFTLGNNSCNMYCKFDLWFKTQVITSKSHTLGLIWSRFYPSKIKQLGILLLPLGLNGGLSQGYPYMFC